MVGCRWLNWGGIWFGGDDVCWLVGKVVVAGWLGDGD